MRAKKTQPINTTDAIWKIRRKSDGLFSNGAASYPGFNKQGKSFSSEKKVLSHLLKIKRWMTRRPRVTSNPTHPYLGCEIVQFKVIEESAVSFVGYGE